MGPGQGEAVHSGGWGDVAVCERAVPFAGDAIAGGGVMETRNDIGERAYTIRAGFDVPCTAHSLHPIRCLARRPNGEQGGVIEALRIETGFGKRALVGKYKRVGRVLDAHQLMDEWLTGAVLGAEIRILGVVHPRVVVCDTSGYVVVEVALVVTGFGKTSEGRADKRPHISQVSKEGAPIFRMVFQIHIFIAPATMGADIPRQETVCVEVTAPRSGESVVILLGVHLNCQRETFEVSLTRRRLGLFLCLSQCRHQYRHQNGNYGNNNEKFYKSERSPQS